MSHIGTERTANTLLTLGLADRLQLVVFPVVLGAADARPQAPVFRPTESWQTPVQRTSTATRDGGLEPDLAQLVRSDRPS